MSVNTNVFDSTFVVLTMEKLNNLKLFWALNPPSKKSEESSPPI